MDIVNRLKRYMEHVELPISQFADVALIPRPTLSQILSGRNKKISNELMSKLHTAFPKLNISWLLFGDGPMEIGAEYVSSDDTIYTEAQKKALERKTSAHSNSEKGLFDYDNTDTKPVIPPVPNINPFVQQAAAKSNRPISLSPDANKRIESIVVFYSDKSFETFYPPTQG